MNRLTTRTAISLASLGLVAAFLGGNSSAAQAGGACPVHQPIVDLPTR